MQSKLIIRLISHCFRSLQRGKKNEIQREKSARCMNRAELKRQFGCDPSEGDVHWRMLAKEAQEHWLNRDWGRYRNTRFRQGEQCRKEKKLKTALSFYCWTCYLDANGPNNVGPPSPDFDFQPIQFSPMAKNIFAPGVIDRTQRIIQALSLTEPEVGKIFLKIARREHKAIRLPVNPEDAWEKLRHILFDKGKR